MRHLLILQTLLHLPSLFFLLLLAVAIFFLTAEESFSPLNTESEATDVVWSRHTPEGEVVRMRATHIQRRQDGVVGIKQVDIHSESDDIRIHLYGEEGETDVNYQQIHLSTADGELTISNGDRITLSLEAALYYLDGNYLQGKNARIIQPDRRLSGDYFVWNGEDIILRGNVAASYLPAAEKGVL